MSSAVMLECHELVDSDLSIGRPQSTHPQSVQGWNPGRHMLGDTSPLRFSSGLNSRFPVLNVFLL